MTARAMDFVLSLHGLGQGIGFGLGVVRCSQLDSAIRAAHHLPQQIVFSGNATNFSIQTFDSVTLLMSPPLGTRETLATLQKD